MVCQMVVLIISDFFMQCYRITLVDHQLLNTVLKGLIRIFVEMQFVGVSYISQLSFETRCLLLFCFLSYPTPLQKIEHID